MKELEDLTETEKAVLLACCDANNFSLGSHVPIEANIHQKDYDTIGKYYDVSKLVSVKPRNIPHKEPEENITVEAEFPLLISEAIEYICEEIPLTPEEFIVDTVNGEIDILIDNVKEDCYDFLDKYKDFSKIAKSIKRFYKEGPL